MSSYPAELVHAVRLTYETGAAENIEDARDLAEVNAWSRAIGALAEAIITAEPGATVDEVIAIADEALCHAIERCARRQAEGASRA